LKMTGEREKRLAAQQREAGKRSTPDEQTS
jgi:hypothetical protein